MWGRPVAKSARPGQWRCGFRPFGRLFTNLRAGSEPLLIQSLDAFTVGGRAPWFGVEIQGRPGGGLLEKAAHDAITSTLDSEKKATTISMLFSHVSKLIAFPCFIDFCSVFQIRQPAQNQT